MARILIVEDSPEQARVVSALLQAAGFESTIAEDGRRALTLLETELIDLVVTDLIMPRMSGLELVEKIRRRYPSLPVILITAFGSDEIAVKALEQGAASYVPKQRLAEELIDTVESTVGLARERRERELVLDHLEETTCRFELENDQSLIAPLVGYVQESVSSRFHGYDENALMQLGVALQEALLNAMHHGNLEVSSELRKQGSRPYHEEIERRRRNPAFRDRKVRLEARMTAQELVCEVEDEGPGFDPTTIPDPTDPANVLKVSGRGLYLIFTFMDEVRYNSTGNRITMVKRLNRRSEEA